jgi:hypothetical protein
MARHERRIPAGPDIMQASLRLSALCLWLISCLLSAPLDAAEAALHDGAGASAAQASQHAAGATANGNTKHEFASRHTAIDFGASSNARSSSDRSAPRAAALRSQGLQSRGVGKQEFGRFPSLTPLTRGASGLAHGVSMTGGEDRATVAGRAAVGAHGSAATHLPAATNRAFSNIPAVASRPATSISALAGNCGRRCPHTADRGTLGGTANASAVPVSGIDGRLVRRRF